MIKKYSTVKDFIGWDKTEKFVQDLILNNSVKSILEIGAGANPTISPGFIKQYNLNYTISDVDDDELKKADEIYSGLVLNLSSRDFQLADKFDLVFSRMVGEHIRNGKLFHQNVFEILSKGGLSFHCFSTLYSFPFAANRFLPGKIGDLLLDKIAPRDKYQHGKFKAYYDWCRGPSHKMINGYKDIGYEIVEYVGYFGHNYYKNIPLLRKIEELKSKLLMKFPFSLLTAYAHLVLRKPT